MTTKEETLYLDYKFEELEELEENGYWEDVCYVIHKDGEVEFCVPHNTEYPVLSSEEIFKLAEILKEKGDKNEFKRKRK